LEDLRDRSQQEWLFWGMMAQKGRERVDPTPKHKSPRGREWQSLKTIPELQEVRESPREGGGRPGQRQLLPCPLMMGIFNCLTWTQYRKFQTDIHDIYTGVSTDELAQRKLAHSHQAGKGQSRGLGPKLPP
jgi:hypothetical protein